jgi:hypothetical protein
VLLKSGKIEFSIKDCLEFYKTVLQERPELTPVAIKAGRLLAERLFAGSKVQMEYDKVPE